MTSDAESVLREVETWWHSAGLASLELPDGWFGGPGRSLHQLTRSLVIGTRVLMVLDDQLLLVITRPTAVTHTDEDLTIGAFEQTIFDWQEYGNNRSLVKTYNVGQIRFVSQPNSVAS